MEENELFEEDDLDPRRSPYLSATGVLLVPSLSARDESMRTDVCLGSFVVSSHIPLPVLHQLTKHTLKMTAHKATENNTGHQIDIRFENWGWAAKMEDLKAVPVTAAFTTVFTLGSRSLARAGLRWIWTVTGKDLWFRMYLRGDRLARNIGTADIERANSHSRNANGSRADIQVINKLLPLCFPQHKQALESSMGELDEGKCSGREDFDAFFEQVKDCQQTLEPPPNYRLSLDGMTSRLRPYQKDSVRFMMHRELSPHVEQLDYLYRSIRLSNDLYYYPYLGVFCETMSDEKMPPVVGGVLADEMGLGKTVEFLALTLSLTRENMGKVVIEEEETLDQMSVGCPVRETLTDLVSSVVASVDGQVGLKSIQKKAGFAERLQNTCFGTREQNALSRSKGKKAATIDCHNCDTNCVQKTMHWSQEYTADGHIFYCPHCMGKNEFRLPISATLIILPQAILHQWYEEIRKHVKENVVIDIYRGVAIEGYKHPVYLAKCHIVLCAYETLVKEIDFTNPTRQTRVLRKRAREPPKRVTSPLLAAHWFRIGIDESQLVNDLPCEMGELCDRISARARWCITGTPLQHSVNDMFGAVSLLGCRPLTSASLWNYRFCQGWKGPLAPHNMIILMANLMCRRTKKDTVQQLNLPGISKKVVEVIFSPLEERLYSEKLRELRERIKDLLKRRKYDWDTPLNKLPSLQYTELMTALNQLRLTIVTGGSHLGYRNKKERGNLPFSPKGLYWNLVLKNKRDVEGEMIKAVNWLLRLAGVQSLFDKERACLTYGRVAALEQRLEGMNQMLELKEEGDKDRVMPMHVSSRQLVHLARNWQRAMGNEDNEEGRLLQRQLEDTYATAEKRHTLHDTIQLDKLVVEWTEMEKEWPKWENLYEDCFGWMRDVPDDRVADRSYLERCLTSMRLAVEKQRTDSVELRDMVTSWVTDKMCTREDLKKCGHNKVWKTRNENPTGEIGNMPDRLFFLDEENGCSGCQLRKAVYTLQTREGIVNEQMAPLQTHRSAMFQQYYELLEQLNCRKAPEKQLEIDSRVRLSAWGDLRGKCTTLAHRLMDTVQELVTRHLELDKAVHATVKIGQLVDSFCPETRQTKKVKVVAKETQDMKAACAWLESNIGTGMARFARNASRITYLRSLSVDAETQIEPPECPICLIPVAEEWYCFPCGHVTCDTCYPGLKNTRTFAGFLECVTCREKTALDVISIVRKPLESREYSLRDSAIPGRILTVKFNALLKRINELLAENYSNKLLLFTSMTSSVNALCDVLTAAHVPYSLLAKSTAPQTLAAFRNEISQRVLVVPLNVGANGLNLNHANHVLFLEPITEPSVISQAIGRMSRFGQNRSMTVHHFVVKGSVEEEILRTSEGGEREDAWTVRTLVNVLGIAD